MNQNVEIFVLILKYQIYFSSFNLLKQ